MIRDYWYIIAFSAVIAILSIQLAQFYLCAIFVIWLIIMYYQKKIPLLVLFLSLIALFFFYAYIPSHHEVQSSTNPQVETQTTFQGKITSPVNETKAKVEFTFREELSNETILAVSFINDTPSNKVETAHLLVGGTCVFSGEISKPDSARNPHQFDYQQYLLQQGITYQLYLTSLADIECENANLLHYIQTIRGTLLQSTINKLDERMVAWLHALVLGDDRLIDDETIDIFQRWSLSHILAISGLHIGIVVGMLYIFLVRTSLYTKEHAQWIIIAFLPIYALVAGGQPSVLRASLMVLFVVVLNKLKWKLNYTDVISIVFLLLILYDRFIVYHIGFQLSFAVTFGLIISQYWISQSPSNIVRILQISFISQMIILPLQLHYFSLFQPLSILLNLLMVPYFSLFVIPAMFGLLALHWLPQMVLSVFEFGFLFIHGSVLSLLEWMDKYLDYPFIIGEIPLYFTIVYYVLLIILMKSLEDNQLKRAFQYGVFITVLLITLTLRPYFSPVGSVTMLDIGQGDAYIIELPYRKGVFFIDMGTPLTFPDFAATDKTYNQIIKPYLYGQGITKIDAVFLSHEDLDHYGSLMYALEDIQIDEIIISPFYEVDETSAILWREKETDIYRMDFNESILRNGQLFQSLAPSEDQFDANENSLVLLTRLGSENWLFTGDIGKKTEKGIVHSYPGLDVDVLKVGHHGSNTSTDPSFIKKITPGYAFISVGVNNSYGHPTKEVVETLENEGVIIYRTDEHGAVQYFFTEEGGMFVPFLEQ